MSEQQCAGCRERDLRIQQLCVEARSLDEKANDYHAELKSLRRQQENPK